MLDYNYKGDELILLINNAFNALSMEQLICEVRYYVFNKED
nr:MAG TPA: hypothetical protein [Bacteriophage sp.]